MNILFLAAECAPFVKVGGLADVIGALPQVLNRLGGHSVRVMLPHHGAIDDARFGIEPFDAFDLRWNRGTTRVEVSQMTQDGVETYFIRGWPYFAASESFVYRDDEGIDVGRFLFFCAASLELAKRLAVHDGWHVDVIHVHDWHMGSAPYLLDTVYADDPLLGDVPTLFSIHNMMYQGWGAGWHLTRATLPPVDHPLLVAMRKTDNTLAIGVAYSTMLSTVSPTYAFEITTMEGGYGLDGLLHARQAHLIGILNGIDAARWNPATSTAITANFDVSTVHRRLSNKLALQRELGLAERKDVPLIAAVMRLVDQKGPGLMADALRHVLWNRDIQFVLLGSGLPHFEAQMAALRAEFPARISVNLTFDEPLSERIYAGSDLFLMPSLFEPCGIGQMLAMRFGSLPLVRQVGGLADTVSPETGFLFSANDTGALIRAIWHALDVFGIDQPRWQAMQRRAMLRDFSWEASARRYLELYQQTLDVHHAYA